MDSTNDGILAATWAVVLATATGPIVAVQVQKILERIKERNSRKIWVFHTLMATRGQRVSPDHVTALNMIDLAFYGTQRFGIHRRHKNEQAVIDTWREYLVHLNRGPIDKSDTNVSNWTASGNELFYNVLFAVATDVGYDITREQLKAGGYAPMAHGYIESEQSLIRQNAARVLTGQQPLKFEVTSFPINKDVAKAQSDIQTKLLAALENGTLSVQLKDPTTISNDQGVLTQREATVQAPSA